MQTWNASIEETEERNGTFRAALHEQPVEIVSRDPEHDLCHAIVNAGLADGPIQFWRCGTPSLLYRSAHKTGEKRIELGESFPLARVPRRTAADFAASPRGAITDGETERAGTHGLPEGGARG